MSGVQRQGETPYPAGGATGILMLGIGPDGTYQPMGVVQPGSEPTAYITGGDMSGAITGSTIDCLGRKRITFLGTIESTDDPEGQIYIQGSPDGSTWFDLPLELGKVLSDHASVTHTGADLTMIDVDDPDADAHFAVSIVRPYPYMRVRYAADAGGNSAGLDVVYVFDL